MEHKYDVAVIGAGLAGIAAALRLNKKGYRTIVLEKNPTHGGKLSEFSWGDYRWDKGPSLFTLPNQVDELFELYGKNPRDHFEYVQMDDSCHYYFSDGSDFLFRFDPADRDADLRESFDEKNSQAAIDYIEESKKTYAAIGDLFIDHAQYGLKNIFDKALLKRYPMFLSRKLLGSLDQFNRRKFTDPNLIQLFNRYATYNGSDPYRMSGLYSMIPHLEMNDGTYFPKKGMRSIVDSLCQLAKENGVDVLYDQTDIKVREEKYDGKAYVVSSRGEEYAVEKVVSAIDCINFYDKIIDDKKLATKYRNRERSASAVVFYWAVEKVIPELKLHNIFFTSNYKKEFEGMFGKQMVPEEPTVYIHVSSTVNPEDAPANGQNWFVMINVAAGLEITEEVKEKFRQHIAKLIQDRFGVAIRDHIQHEESWEPKRIEEYTGGFAGALYGASCNGTTAALTRHGNDSKKYKEVYFCGGTVHPGGGIPLVLKSAKIVSQLIEEKK